MSTYFRPQTSHSGRFGRFWRSSCSSMVISSRSAGCFLLVSQIQSAASILWSSFHKPHDKGIYLLVLPDSLNFAFGCFGLSTFRHPLSLPTSPHSPQAFFFKIVIFFVPYFWILRLKEGSSPPPPGSKIRIIFPENCKDPQSLGGIRFSLSELCWADPCPGMAP